MLVIIHYLQDVANIGSHLTRNRLGNQNCGLRLTLPLRFDQVFHLSSNCRLCRSLNSELLDVSELASAPR